MRFKNFELMKQHDGYRAKSWYFTLPEPVGEFNAMKVWFYYDQGGMNYFSGSVKPRGYYVSLSPVGVSPGVEMSQPMSGGGGYVLVEETARFNAKTFNNLVATVERRVAELADSVMADVRMKAGVA